MKTLANITDAIAKKTVDATMSQVDIAELTREALQKQGTTTAACLVIGKSLGTSLAKWDNLQLGVTAKGVIDGLHTKHNNKRGGDMARAILHTAFEMYDGDKRSSTISGNLYTGMKKNPNAGRDKGITVKAEVTRIKANFTKAQIKEIIAQLG